jgi:hypothetical protein
MAKGIGKEESKTVLQRLGPVEFTHTHGDDSEINHMGPGAAPAAARGMRPRIDSDVPQTRPEREVSWPGIP